MHVWKVLSTHTCSCSDSLVGIVSAPSTFGLALLLLFVFLLHCVTCSSVGNMDFSKHIQSLSVLAVLAIIVHSGMVKSSTNLLLPGNLKY